MRELRVVGVEADGTHVICQDPETAERYRIAADERLRAAARGDRSRLGQIEIEMQSALRPREIQARIRGGASVAEVAAMAGVGHEKIERFAHPVLLERTRAAELASLAHPIREDGPSAATLGEVVADAMAVLGHSTSELDWDAWKGDDGFWVVQIAWYLGRTEQLAHWRYIPGPHGGTADPLDDLADEITHPEYLTPRRRLTPVATPEIEVATEIVDGHEQVTVDANRIIDAQRHHPKAPATDAHGTVALDFGDLTPVTEPRIIEERADEPQVEDRADEAPATEPELAAPEPIESTPPRAVDSFEATAEPVEVIEAAEPAESLELVEPVESIAVDLPADEQAPEDPVATAPVSEPVAAPATEPRPSDTADSAGTPDTTESTTTESIATDRTDDTTDPTDTGSTDVESPAEPIPPKPRHRKSRKPAVPAWEDVLLGVRSSGHS